MKRIGFYKENIVSSTVAVIDSTTGEELHISNPETLTDEEVIRYGYIPVSRPEPGVDFDADTHKLGGVVIFSDRVEYSLVPTGYIQTDGIEDSYNRLWQAASKYEREFISGSAIGLVTLGVLTQKPKAIAIAMWQQSIWARYYAKKADLAGSELVQDMLDFSECGAMPYTVPDLMEEVTF